MPSTIANGMMTVAQISLRNGPVLTVGPFGSTMLAHEWRSSFNEQRHPRHIHQTWVSLAFVENTTLCDIDPEATKVADLVADLDELFKWKGQAKIWHLSPGDHEDLLIELCGVLGLERFNEINQQAA